MSCLLKKNYSRYKKDQSNHTTENHQIKNKRARWGIKEWQRNSHIINKTPIVSSYLSIIILIIKGINFSNNDRVVCG